MKDILSQSIKILLPPLLGLFLIGFAIWKLFYSEISKAIVELQIGILTLPIEEGQRKYLILAGLGVILLIFAIVRDYSQVFPDKMTLHIFFDTDELDRLVKKYRAHDIVRNKVPENWQLQSGELQNHMLDTIATHAKIKPNYTKKQATAGRGVTTFVVKKCSWHAQAYQVTEVEGLLNLQIPVLGESDSAKIGIKTFSSLLNSRTSIFSIDYKKMLFNWHFYVSPLLQQSFYSGAIRETVIYDTLALTRVRFFPFIAIEETLYLVEVETRSEADIRREWFPVAYSVYDQ